MVRQPVLKVTRFSRDEQENIYDTEGEVLGSIISSTARLGIESIKDVFSIKIPNTLINPDTNSWSSYTTKKVISQNVIKPNDYIKVESYYSTPDSNEQNNIVIVGEVTDFSYDNEEGTPIVNISGANITENLLSGFTLVSKKFDDLDATVPEIVIEVINRLNTANLAPQKRIFAALDTDTISFGNISDVTGSSGNVVSSSSTGSTFPNTSYSKTWQPAYKILEDLSTPEYTDDGNAGNYIFYIKPTPVLPQHQATIGTPYINELVFKPPSTTVDKVLTRGDDYSTISSSRDVSEVKNVLIVKPGTSSDGTGITTYVVNESSLAENGPKYGFWSKPELGNAILKDIRNAGINQGSSFDGYLPQDINNGSSWTFTTLFPRNDAFPYTITSSTPITVVNEEDYHSAVRDEITLRGKSEAQRIVDNLGEATFKSDVELVTGSNNIGMGTLIELQDKTSGWDGTDSNPNYRLRVRDIRHSWDANGWNTTLVCVEDEKVLSENLNS